MHLITLDEIPFTNYLHLQLINCTRGSCLFTGKRSALNWESRGIKISFEPHVRTWRMEATEWMMIPLQNTLLTACLPASVLYNHTKPCTPHTAVWSRSPSTTAAPQHHHHGVPPPTPPALFPATRIIIHLDQMLVARICTLRLIYFPDDYSPPPPSIWD